MHHGVGRTKSSVELAKYDVVLTTFAVVGLEVTARWQSPANGTKRKRKRKRKRSRGGDGFLGRRRRV